MKNSKPKHTPGPWTIERSASTFSIARITPKPGFEDSRNIIETVFLQTDAGCLIPNSANAALIAAAPDMLEALENAANELHSYDVIARENTQLTKLLLDVEAAIRKAKGETV